MLEATRAVRCPGARVKVPDRSPHTSRRVFLGGGIGLTGHRLLAQAGSQGTSGQDQAARQRKPALEESIGSELELFVDRHRIDSMAGVELRLHPVRFAGTAIRLDRPWEGPTSAYVTVFEDQGRCRMYYRGSPGSEGTEVTCYAESSDGIEWHKPDLGLFEWGGSKSNNIVLRGLGTHNFTPFRDSRPGVPEHERYKAVARGTDPRDELHGFVSPDGVRWTPVSNGPVFTEGRFDSQNVAFWDATRRKYRCYFRTPYRRVRGIGVVESEDFRRWEGARLVTLDPPDPEHFYTNATIPYLRNPRYRLAFPKRFVPERRRLSNHSTSGISEAVFMSSRDGLHFDRTFMEAWIRPGPDPRNWGDRSSMPAWGLLRTAEREISVLVSQHYRFDSAHLVRGTLRLDGFASAHAGYAGGELVTAPLTFKGSRLELNYSTGAAGSVRIELQRPNGEPVPEFALNDAPDLYGDEIQEAFRWKQGGDVSLLEGKRVRIRFVLKDCDLYSYRFAT